MELKIDDGQYIYEGDIVYQQTEYEFEIDANTGDFLNGVKKPTKSCRKNKQNQKVYQYQVYIRL